MEVRAHIGTTISTGIIAVISKPVKPVFQELLKPPVRFCCAPVNNPDAGTVRSMLRV